MNNIEGNYSFKNPANRCKLSYIERINNEVKLKVLPKNYIQYPMLNHNGKEYFKSVHMYVSIYPNQWVGKIPWSKKWQPTAGFLLRESPWAETSGLLSKGLQSLTQLSH